jgi:hypothetical protein
LPANALKPIPVQVHLGISDGIYTEVLDGLQDDDMVVDALLSSNPSASPAPPVKRPF